jgi:RNA polymerase sigma-70 factor (ECF subfamily)
MTRVPIRKVSSSFEHDWDWGHVWRSCLAEARRVVRSPEAAEEVAQNAMVRAWRRRSTCRQPDQAVGWLSRIARNEALRHVALERKRRETAFDEDALTRPGVLDEPIDGLVAALDLDSLVSSLPPADRELVRLRYVEDLTHSQIAECLGVPVGTAKVRLHRLRRRLQDRLEKQL